MNGNMSPRGCRTISVEKKKHSCYSYIKICQQAFYDACAVKASLPPYSLISTVKHLEFHVWFQRKAQKDLLDSGSSTFGL